MQSWNKNAYYLTQELDGVSIDSQCIISLLLPNVCSESCLM